MSSNLARLALLLVLATVSAVAAVSASADSTPVGPLPKGPVTTVSAPSGSLVSVALPRQRASSGLVWRVARQVNARVLRQQAEADVGASVVVVFKALRAGNATVAFALTRGDASAKALRSVTYRVRVR